MSDRLNTEFETYLTTNSVQKLLLNHKFYNSYPLRELRNTNLRSYVQNKSTFSASSCPLPKRFSRTIHSTEMTVQRTRLCCHANNTNR